MYRKGKLLKIYRVALGDSPVGHKHFEGDEKMPEGLYFINDRNAASSYHKNLGISYPNGADRAYAQKAGRPPRGAVKIHGLPKGEGPIGSAHPAHERTNSFLAVTNEEIDELRAFVKKGAPILIVP